MRMTMGYSLERKEAMLKKMLPPNNQSIAVLAKEEGISDATLYNWRQQARNECRGRTGRPRHHENRPEVLRFAVARRPV